MFNVNGTEEGARTIYYSSLFFSRFKQSCISVNLLLQTSPLKLYDLKEYQLITVLWIGWMVSLFLSPRFTHADTFSWHV